MWYTYLFTCELPVHFPVSIYPSLHCNQVYTPYHFAETYLTEVPYDLLIAKCNTQWDEVSVALTPVDYFLLKPSLPLTFTKLHSQCFSSMFSSLMSHAQPFSLAPSLLPMIIVGSTPVILTTTCALMNPKAPIHNIFQVLALISNSVMDSSIDVFLDTS